MDLRYKRIARVGEGYTYSLLASGRAGGGGGASGPGALDHLPKEILLLLLGHRDGDRRPIGMGYDY